MANTDILNQEQVAEIEALANAATKGPWAVHDSCSWRRIGTTEPYGDGNVICPTTQQGDNHPDLLAKREDLEFAARARTDIPALCRAVRAAWADRNTWQRTAEVLDQEKTALREQLAQTQVELRRWRNGDQLPEGWACLDVGNGFPNLYLYSRTDIVEQAKAQLAQVEKERDELQRYARTADESAAEMEIKNHEQRDSWRSHVILICGEKVAEYERAMRNRVARTAFTKTFADAASEIRTEVERL